MVVESFSVVMDGLVLLHARRGTYLDSSLGSFKLVLIIVCIKNTHYIFLLRYCIK